MPPYGFAARPVDGAKPGPCPLCQAPTPTQAIRFSDRKVCLECAADIPLELHVPAPEVTA